MMLYSIIVRHIHYTIDFIRMYTITWFLIQASFLYFLPNHSTYPVFCHAEIPKEKLLRKQYTQHGNTLRIQCSLNTTNLFRALFHYNQYEWKLFQKLCFCLGLHNLQKSRQYSLRIIQKHNSLQVIVDKLYIDLYLNTKLFGNLSHIYIYF